MTEAADQPDRARADRATVAELRVPVAPGVTLHAERRDGDPAAMPFVLVHGLASNLRLWDGVAEDAVEAH